MLKFDNPWLLLFYPILYCSAVYLFKNCYYDKIEDEANERENHYYVPVNPWLNYWYFRILLWKHAGLIRYPDSEAGEVYVNYRELQCTIVLRALVFPFLIADILLFICQSSYVGICVIICMILHIIIENIFAYPVLKHDYKRMKSYRYVIANADEAILSDARKKPPRLWKINTLHDVFFYFGEARIRYCETQNYLVYRLKNGNLLYVFLKDSFETMPVPKQQAIPPFYHYNHAMAVWVDEVIILDKNLQNYDQLLTMKNIKPQDMPENFC